MAEMNDQTVIWCNPEFSNKNNKDDDNNESDSDIKIKQVHFDNSDQHCLWLFKRSDNQLINMCSELLGITLKLSAIDKPEDIADIRYQILSSIKNINQLAREANFSTAVIDKTMCIFTIVIDEFIHYSQWGEDLNWSNNALLSEVFGMKKNGGELFFTLSDKALRQPKKLIDFIELIYLFLNIGYKGKYRFSDKESLNEYIKNLRSILSKYRQKHEIAFKSTNNVTHHIPSTNNFFRVISLLTTGLFIFSFLFVFLLYKTTYKNRTLDWETLPQFTYKNTIQNNNEFDYLSVNEDFIENKSQLNSKQNVINTHELTWQVELARFSNRKEAYEFLSSLSKSNHYMPVIITENNQFSVRVKAGSLLESKEVISFYLTANDVKGKIIKIPSNNNGN